MAEGDVLRTSTEYLSSDARIVDNTHMLDRDLKRGFFFFFVISFGILTVA